MGESFWMTQELAYYFLKQFKFAMTYTSQIREIYFFIKLFTQKIPSECSNFESETHPFPLPHVDFCHLHLMVRHKDSHRCHISV